MRIINYHKLVQDIESWIKDYVQSAKVEGVVIGLSGGIDSAVTAALCTNALGNEKVYGINLPCESIPQDTEDATLVAKSLGLKFVIIDLTHIYNQYLKLLNEFAKPDLKACANLKARIRMMTLYYFGQTHENYLVAGTGNRAELAIGYFTKYGDAGVDFKPIGDLYKSEVRECAKLLNIPRKIIEKPPSPGLWLGQTDEDEIGLSYDFIDEVLYHLDYSLDLKGMDQKNLEKVQKMMQNANHKLNMPPKFIIKKIIN